ncbi:MAG: VTT domain-containing protein [Verrucomicrobiaceae bacterium]|nr:VTT domain-containing protein [Verrucomicrobiaceae bacterium]
MMEPPDQQEEPLISNEVEQETSRALGKETRQVLTAVLIVAAFMALAHFTPMKAWITNVQSWKGFVREFGWLAHAVFMLVTAGAVMMGVPRLAFCSAAGLIFGFGEGLLLSLVGSTLGSYGAFILSRHGFRRAAEARAEKWPWLKKMLKKPSVMRVFWARQLMVPGIVLNVLIGMTPVRHSRFLLGTALGYLPLNIAFSLVGSGLGKENITTTMTQLLAAMAVINVAAWLVFRYMRSTRLK